MKKTDTRDCSVVILSYNTCFVTNQCIQRVRKAAISSEKKLHNKIEIIVVDNHSTDGTVEMIRKKYSFIKLIALSENIGVAKGYNLGMKAAKNPYILIINSDTYLDEDTLEKSIAHMETNPDCDVFICKLFNGKGEFHPYGGHLPTPFKTIRWLLGFESIPFLKYHIRRIYQYNEDFYQKQAPMEWAPTCFFFLRRKVYQQTKGHDEKMFFYMEDLEWAKRIKDKGFHLWYVPSITSVHLGGASSEKKMDYGYLLKRQVEGLRYYYKKHYPWAVWLVELFLRFGFLTRACFYFLKAQRNQAISYSQLFLAR